MINIYRSSDYALINITLQTMDKYIRLSFIHIESSTNKMIHQFHIQTSPFSSLVPHVPYRNLNIDKKIILLNLISLIIIISLYMLRF